MRFFYWSYPRTLYLGMLRVREQMHSTFNMWKITLSVFLVAFFGNTVSATFGKEECPIFQKPFPFRTPTPSNVDTNKVTPIDATSPLIVQINALNLVYISNTGKAIEFTRGGFLDDSYVSGSVLCDNIYSFYKIRYYVNQNGSRSASAVDGDGSAFEVHNYFYNKKYATFENALLYRDGVVVISNIITITDNPAPNLLFVPIQKILEFGLLRQPGSKFPLINLFAYAWFDDAYLLRKYYVYPGSYTDLHTGKDYDSVTFILTTPNYAYISKKQFQAFKNVLSSSETPIETTESLEAQGHRPVFEVNGRVKQNLVFY